ncbi:ATP-binding cassette domain-containing protein [Candidatus Latescibacterota bacterium]
MSECAIVTRGLSRSFDSALAVDRLDLEVPTGSVFGFIGRNGAGKTTTIRMLLDLLRPDAGSIEVLGMDPRQASVEIKRRVGYVSETPQLYRWMRVGELVRFTSRYYETWYLFPGCRTGVSPPSTPRASRYSQRLRGTTAPRHVGRSA